jgi:hypothetical protein
MKSLKERLTALANGDFSYESENGGGYLPVFQPKEMQKCVQAMQLLVEETQRAQPAGRLLPPSLAIPLIL